MLKTWTNVRKQTAQCKLKLRLNTVLGGKISFTMFFSQELWHARPRKIKFSRRSRSRASGKSSRSKKSPSLSSTRLLRESLRGKRAGNFPYNGPRKGNSLKWVRADSAWTHLLPLHLSVYLYSHGLAGSDGGGKWSERVRARSDPGFGLPSIEFFRYRHTNGLYLVIRHRRADARGSPISKCTSKFVNENASRESFSLMLINSVS